MGIAEGSRASRLLKLLRGLRCVEEQSQVRVAEPGCQSHRCVTKRVLCLDRGAAENQELGKLLVGALTAAEVQSCLAIGVPHIKVGIFHALKKLDQLHIVSLGCIVQ